VLAKVFRNEMDELSVVGGEGTAVKAWDGKESQFRKLISLFAYGPTVLGTIKCFWDFRMPCKIIFSDVLTNEYYALLFDDENQAFILFARKDYDADKLNLIVSLVQFLLRWTCENKELIILSASE